MDLFGIIDNVKLSPSFYFPSNLLVLENVQFTHLAAQLGSFMAWSALPEYDQRCQEYFTEPRSKSDFLFHTRSLLGRGDLVGARELLLKTVSFQWPETLRFSFEKELDKNIYYLFRILSRLFASAHPNQALLYATTASELGDIGAPAIQAHMIDYGMATSCSLIGKDRLSAISQLIVKLDPVYAFHANTLASVKETCFIKHLIGNGGYISLYNFIPIINYSILEWVYNTADQGYYSLYRVSLHYLSL